MDELLGGTSWMGMGAADPWSGVPYPVEATTAADLVEPYPFVPQKVWRMGTQNNLSSGATLHACEHLRQVTHDLGMKRQFRFFEQKWSAAFHRNPQQAHEPQSAVGELFLGLPCALGPPVFVFSAQVRCTAIVTNEFDFSQLGNRHL
jgi:hypothetical protein